MAKRFCIVILVFLFSFHAAQSSEKTKKAPAGQDAPWYLQPVARPTVPANVTASANPIDAFISAQYRKKRLTPVGPADRAALLRRVHLDLTGIPPTPAEQDAFLKDGSLTAYEKVVDRLLASEQHGVRYARHWLDVLRYSDADDGMFVGPGIHHWREWVIRALNSDMPYDQFVCTQLTCYRTTARTEVSALGFQERIVPRPDDMFALGFLARGAVMHGDVEQELAIAAVETVSTAFMGMTVGCAKCHDHMYDPISQRDFYRMKALFDPLVPRKVLLSNAAEAVARGKTLDDLGGKIRAVEQPMLALIAPYKKKLFDERVAQLPPDVQTVIRKQAKERTPTEEKIADDYFPILRIDVSKIMLIMPEAEKDRYRDLVKEYKQLQETRSATELPVFWTVETDRKKEMEKSYILTSGDPARPQKKNEVGSGWPFAPDLALGKLDIRTGRVEAFVDWLTAADNPLFARVAVNRLWQWHFGEGLLRTPSDFGVLGGAPSHPQLLDWLASEFVRRKYSMKEMHRLIVTSQTYRLASSGEPALVQANGKIDQANTHLWRFRLRRLDAETVWDSIFSAAGKLDLAIGGLSFDPAASPTGKELHVRRGAYIFRGFASNRDIMPAFLQAFDADDGRAPCPLRTHTVTAPQALFLMNSEVIDRASKSFAARLRKAAGNDLQTAVNTGYRTALSRPPTATEMSRTLAYLGDDWNRLPGLAWLMFNLDEFVFVR